jgi:hypothetical protein
MDGEAWLNPPSIGCDEYYGLGPLQVALQATHIATVNKNSWVFTEQILGSITTLTWNFGFIRKVCTWSARIGWESA